MTTGRIRIGIGGWTFAGWRGNFYPDAWPRNRELEYTAAQLTAVEVDGTYFRSFKPAVFAGWRDQVPDGFVFALKGSRYTTNRKVLAEAGESVARYVGQGIAELGDRLGPILWQLPARKQFDADDIRAFLALLPTNEAGVPLRHAIQVRHASFATPEFVALCRAARVAIVHAQSDAYPALADVSGDFAYVRLEVAADDEPLGYAPAALDRWADAARIWAAGGQPDDLPYASPEAPPTIPRDTFVFFIGGAKVRNPAAAQALIERV